VLAADAQLESNDSDAKLGISVAGAGDVNGDGFADVIVGADGYTNGENQEGAAFLWTGSDVGIVDGDPVSALAQLEGDQDSAGMGSSVAAAGDVNGDGFADIIVGAEHYDSGQDNEGAAFVFLGNDDATGRPVLARQRRGSGGQPVQPWGGSNASDAFVVEITATHPAGTGRVKAEIEYCETGVAFGDASCGSAVSASWVDVGPAAPNIALSETISGLVPDTLYRWRARVLYDPANSAGLTIGAHGPWRRVSGQAVEADIRVVPEPGPILSLVFGIAMLGGLHCGRVRRGVRWSERGHTVER
jgi:hypothetical protein